MKHLRLIAASTLAAAILAAPGVASAATGSAATVNQVYATVITSGRGLHTRVHLKISLNGRTAFNRFVTSAACPPGCRPVSLGASPAPVRVLALRANGVPDVVLGLYSGGAHCCFVVQVYRLDAQHGSFTKTEHDFLDAGARIEDLDGDRNYEFVSADARISNAGFTDFADSPPPLQIWSFSGSRFRDITRMYPSRVRRDAAKWLRGFRRQHGNGRGLIAAWAADEDLLGHRGLVSSELKGALKDGRLGVPASFGGPTPAKFVTQLQTLLRRLGYTR